jgi:type IX secretion system PorP/SprF family membrane protein
MTTRYRLVMSLVVTVASITIYAQQAPMYTHYMNNTLVVNPAYAGSREALTVTAISRMQWVDFEGAPVTQSITLHSPLTNEHHALGFSLLNDKIGPTNLTSVVLDYAYRFRLTENANMAFGLSLGANWFQANLSALQLDDQQDPVFLNDINHKLTPDIGFGAYYSRERFYAGFSIPNLLETSYSEIDLGDGTSLIGKEQRHYFFITGALFHVSEYIDFKPTSFIKVTAAAPIEADLTASFILQEKLLLGVMFRTGDAIGGLAGFDITDQFHIGYSYDWSFGLQTGLYNKGTHEIVLRYDFELFNKKQYHSPRYF